MLLRLLLREVDDPLRRRAVIVPDLDRAPPGAVPGGAEIPVQGQDEGRDGGFVQGQRKAGLVVVRHRHDLPLRIVELDR